MSSGLRLLDDVLARPVCHVEPRRTDTPEMPHVRHFLWSILRIPSLT